MTGVRVLVAPDKFKGTFAAAEVAAAVGRGLERAGLEPPDLCPIADGGDGTLAVLRDRARRLDGRARRSPTPSGARSRRASR